MDDRDFQASRTTRLLSFLFLTWLASTFWDPQAEPDPGAGVESPMARAEATAETSTPR